MNAVEKEIIRIAEVNAELLGVLEELNRRAPCGKIEDPQAVYTLSVDGLLLERLRAAIEKARREKEA